MIKSRELTHVLYSMIQQIPQGDPLRDGLIFLQLAARYPAPETIYDLWKEVGSMLARRFLERPLDRWGFVVLSIYMDTTEDEARAIVARLPPSGEPLPSLPSFLDVEQHRIQTCEEEARGILAAFTTCRVADPFWPKDKRCPMCGVIPANGLVTWRGLDGCLCESCAKAWECQPAKDPANV